MTSETMTQTTPTPMTQTFAAVYSLFEKIDAERRLYARFWPPNETKLKRLVEEAQQLGFYPQDTPEGNPSTVLQMVKGYGANWNTWKGPFSCPHCKADLRNHVTGAPFKREIGHIEQDRVSYWSCPDCGGIW